MFAFSLTPSLHTLSARFLTQPVGLEAFSLGYTGRGSFHPFIPAFLLLFPTIDRTSASRYPCMPAEERALTRTRATPSRGDHRAGKTIAGTGFVQRLFWGLRAARPIVLDLLARRRRKARSVVGGDLSEALADSVEGGVGGVVEVQPMVEPLFARCIYNQTVSVECWVFHVESILVWIVPLLKLDSLRETQTHTQIQTTQQISSPSHLFCLHWGRLQYSWSTHNGVVCTLLACAVGIAQRGFSASASETGAGSHATGENTQFHAGYGQLYSSHIRPQQSAEPTHKVATSG